MREVGQMRVALLIAVILAVGAATAAILLPGHPSRPEEVPANDSSRSHAPGDENSTGARLAGAGPAETDGAGHVITSDGQESGDGQAPLATSGRSWSEGVGRVVRGFEAASQTDVLSLRTLLDQLLRMGTAESESALIDLFARGVHLEHHEDLWAGVLADIQDPDVAGVLQGTLQQSAHSGPWTTAGSLALWKLLLERLGDDGSPFVVDVLRSWGLPKSSSTRHAVLSALPSDLPEEAVSIVAEELSTPTNALPAGQALLRSGKASATEAVIDHLCTATTAWNDTGYLILAREAGRCIDKAGLAKLRDHYSREFPFTAAVYANAVSGMSPERIRQESESLLRLVGAAFGDAANSTDLEARGMRRQVATAVGKVAQYVASPALHELFLQEAQSRSGEPELLETARLIEASKANVDPK